MILSSAVGGETRSQEPPTWLERALGWVRQMRSPDSPCRYRLHSQAEPTVFASCFALFFLHLCGETKTLEEEARKAWVDYLLGFQDKDTGLFRDPAAAFRATDPYHGPEHLDWQLTGFCLSALRALRAELRYPLREVAPWCDGQYMRLWLDGLDWTRASNSGNKAMFIAIMLVDELERGNAEAAVGLDAWFDWHGRQADPRTGYWGTPRDCRYFQGMTGFVHQFLVYNYLGRPAPHPKRVLDRTLMLQQPDGLFSPMLGGAACDDLDAIHVLCYLYHTEDYRRQDVRAALRRALQALLANQNGDGGFCWARRFRLSPRDWLTLAVHNMRSGDPYLTYLALRIALSGQYRLKTRQMTGWSAESWEWSQSTLWDTWFRSLAIAEIETALDPATASRRWQVLRAPNFGWFWLPGQ